MATIVMASIGLWVLARLAAPLTATRRALVIGMAAGLILALLIPATRTFFELDWPSPVVLFAAIGIFTVAVVVLEIGGRLVSLTRLDARASLS